MGTDTPPPDFGLPRYPTAHVESAPPDGVPGPLGVMETVGVSFGLYRADAVKLWQVVALIVIPVQVLIFILRVITIPHGSILHNAKIYVPSGSGGGYVGASLVGTLLTQLVLLVSVGATYRILLGRHLHHPADLMTSLSFALERFWSLLWLSLLVFALVLVGFICIVIPGIYLLFALFLAVPVLMAEDLHGWAATVRSRELVSGHWWHVFGAMLVAFITVGVGVGVVSVLLGPIDKAIFPHSITGFFLLNAVIQALISIFFTPFSAAVTVVLYVDMLVRKNDPQLPRLLA